MIFILIKWFITFLILSCHQIWYRKWTKWKKRKLFHRWFEFSRKCSEKWNDNRLQDSELDQNYEKKTKIPSQKNHHATEWEFYISDANKKSVELSRRPEKPSRTGKRITARVPYVMISRVYATIWRKTKSSSSRRRSKETSTRSVSAEERSCWEKVENRF